MKQFRVIINAFVRFSAVWAMVFTLLSGANPALSAPAVSRVAYVYGGIDSLGVEAAKFKTLLNNRGVTVDVYKDSEASLAASDFSVDQAIIVADDLEPTGGSFSFTNIANSGKPIVAIGEWGYQFLQRESLIMVSGSGNKLQTLAYNAHIADLYAPVWSSPSPVSQVNQAIALYTAAVSVDSILNPQPIQYVTRIGRLINDPNHYSLIAQAVGARCYTYWGYRGSADQMTPSGVNLFLNTLFGSPCTPGSPALTSLMATPAPSIDGALNYGEWTLELNPNRLEMDHGFLAVMNDNLRLYIMLDVLESRVNGGGANENQFSVTFDTNKDGQITPGTDLDYGLVPMTHNMRYQHYLAPANWDFLSASTKSSLGAGFGCYTPDNTRVLDINTQTFTCDAHQIWEIAIDLKEINALPGETVHMGIRSDSPTLNFTDEVPNSFDVDFSNLIPVQLVGDVIAPPTPGANIAFTNPPVEITQVVQDVNNSIPLVADKPTAGRVSVKTTGVTTAQPVVEYLYGRRGNADLPGSPLAQLIYAPTTVTRGNLQDSGNFLLPPSWTQSGEAAVHAEASDYNGHDIVSTPEVLLTYQPKAVPVYWMIQENMAAPNAVPDLPAQATLDSYTSYVRTVFPVPDVTFVQKPWTVLGALNGMNLTNNVAAVQAYYAASAAVYWNAILQNKVPPFALPDMIFGAANVGGGLSDPTWYNNGAGRAAAGGSATSGEGVAAHEFNHDLDRTSAGTWGHHVGACNAAGPDPNWPNSPQSDPAIKEYGFDTRLPWQNTASKKTVVPPTFPDLMSYCQSGLLPTKWVSPYRYKAWFGSANFPASLSLNSATAIAQSSLYISGEIKNNGTGALDPVKFAGGMPITPSPAGAYTVQVFYAGGSVESHSFDVSFVDSEGDPISQVPFNFVLPDPGGVSEVKLLKGSAPLADLTKSAVPPQAAFTNPAGSTAFSGTQPVSWNVIAGSIPLAQLRQELDYSADGGSTWTPVALNMPGTLTSYALDTNLLPKSTNGKLRLWVSDGLNNITADSTGVISVGNHPPLAEIIAPSANGFIPAGSQTLLTGDASDVDETTALPDSNFLWKLDGTTVLGIGRSVQVVLPNGAHTLSLTVLDRDGGVGTASTVVFVNTYRVMLPAIRR